MHKFAEFVLKNLDFSSKVRSLLIRIFAPKFPVGVLTVLRQGGKVLLVRQAYKNENSWRLPGGFLEKEENPKQAIKREIEEELGIEIRNLKLKDAVFHKPFTGITIIFEGQVFKNIQLMLSKEISQARFFSTNKLPNNINQFHRSLITKYDKNR